MTPPEQRQPPPTVAQRELAGLLFVGDPHLASRVPGFRKDDYPRAILDKLKWTLSYARENRLLPVLLGDIFDYPRDNANWLLVELLNLFGPGIPAVYGNHDCKENALGDNDTLSVLVASGAVRLLSDEATWTGTIGGRCVTLGGTSWGRKLPRRFDRSSLPANTLVFWAAHHDARFPGYEESARFACFEIGGVDVVVNGHIHRRLEDVPIGATTWVNPGNIARVNRGDITRSHVPAVLRVDIDAAGWRRSHVAVPHRPFEEVFHDQVITAEADGGDSLFIRELKALESIRTAGGAGLRQFLEANLGQFDDDVAAEIRSLADEVLNHGD